MNDRFSGYTLPKIGTSILDGALAEVINWEFPVDEEVQKSAAYVFSKLINTKQNAIGIRIIAI